jgi:hypothetical protein
VIDKRLTNISEKVTVKGINYLEWKKSDPGRAVHPPVKAACGGHPIYVQTLNVHEHQQNKPQLLNVILFIHSITNKA